MYNKSFGEYIERTKQLYFWKACFLNDIKKYKSIIEHLGNIRKISSRISLGTFERLHYILSHVFKVNVKAVEYLLNCFGNVQLN